MKKTFCQKSLILTIFFLCRKTLKSCLSFPILGSGPRGHHCLAHQATASRCRSCSLIFNTMTAGHRLGNTRLVATEKNSGISRCNSVLRDWVEHDDASFHHFDPEEAKEIRDALVAWYRENRRKLPWRGDPPPFDGSTAGVNKVPAGNDIEKEHTKLNQSSITNFFSTTAKPKRKKMESKEINREESEEALSNDVLHDAIPVTAYGVWVSEIMLQQTRVEAVIPYWIKWMKSFPTVQDLAGASEEEVNAHWAGLGFYRRARLLHKGAQHVVNNLDGELPQTVDGLLQISGIGPYTASAIASIAFGVCVPVVDGNVCRVLSRLRGIANHIKAPVLKDRLGWDLAKQIVEAGSGKCAGDVNQAMMELGATYCAPSGTGIDPRDPLRDYYMSTKLGREAATIVSYRDDKIQFDKRLDSWVGKGGKNRQKVEACCELCVPDGVDTVLTRFQEALDDNMGAQIEPETLAKCAHAAFPLEPPKTAKREEDIAVAVLSNRCHRDTWWLFVKRPEKGLLAGQWEFPSVCIQTRNAKSSTPKAQRRRTALTKHLKDISAECGEDLITNYARQALVEPSPIEHIFSHVKHYLWVELSSASTELTTKDWTTSDGKQVRWMRQNDMDKVGITSGVKKILKAVQKEKTSSSATSRKRRKR